jgi:hypothetical protein
VTKGHSELGEQRKGLKPVTVPVSVRETVEHNRCPAHGNHCQNHPDKRFCHEDSARLTQSCTSVKPLRKLF